MSVPVETVLTNLNQQVVGLCEQLDVFERMQRVLILTLAELLPAFARRFYEAYTDAQTTAGPSSSQLLAILEATATKKPS